GPHIKGIHHQKKGECVPGIDIIIGAHDHEPFTLDQGIALIHKCGQNAYWLGRVDFRAESKMISNRIVMPNASIEALVHKYMATFQTSDSL
ncbi:hypothetical protein AeMF1_008701, partial [Aphanomyces euteiches]